ncbi:DUF5054 domain-containing protein [Parapedobacter pyrenivorans]|uniref:DUF5054 domain-containing protein n=1 Tax=Parapedobacter pyrenivorans TaxID=1305674 RepID=UPI003340A6C1
MKNIVLGIVCVVFSAIGMAQEQPKPPIKKVFVIFKTHFDLGYTDLSTAVEQRYVKNFIPKAIDVAEQLRNEKSNAKYVWTTGAWLIDAYLRQASPAEKQKLEEAIRNGDIVWNAAPYTIQSESASKDLFEGMFSLSERLDARYGKKTIAAKMTDVPGHTRSIVTPLYDAGIRFLHIGVNNCSTVPVVPNLCRWRNTDGKEIILMYQDDYGNESVLPDGQTVISFNFTGDNQGPHTAEQVKAIYTGLEQRYPEAEIVASTLNDVAVEVEKIADTLPLLTSEIGDTWIYGYASSPLAMARYRALMRLYSEWLQQGKLERNSDLAIDFAVLLGLFTEHTWGVDHLVHLKQWETYEPALFNASRDLPEFRFSEKSWQEKANRVDEALALLPPGLKEEALDTLKLIGQVARLETSGTNDMEKLSWDGSMRFSYQGAECILGQVAYQTYSTEDFNQFIRDYVRCDGLSYYFTKPGLEKTKAKHATIVARSNKTTSEKVGKNTVYSNILSFPADDRIDAAVLPQQVYNQYVVSADGKSIEMSVSLVNKPAVRLPEAYWVSFFPSDVISVFADKLGMPVDVLDVVEGGNRQMHGVDNHFDIVTGKGVIRITSLDAPVASIGDRRAMNYSLYYPDINGGIHFCLFNNLWTTNFNAWWEGSLTYRFKIEYLSEV